MAADIMPIVCIKRKTFEQYTFLKKVTDRHKGCEPPKDKSVCVFLAKRGYDKKTEAPRGSDGMIELKCGASHSGPRTILTEDGDLYFDLVKDELQKFYKGTLNLKTAGIETARVEKTAVRSFFIEMFGGREFTKKVHEQMCRQPTDCPDPKSPY